MTTEYSIDNGASWHAAKPGHLVHLDEGQAILYRTSLGAVLPSNEPITVKLALPEGALADLMADINKALKLADTVGRSRESNGHAKNSVAVDALVTLQMSIEDRIKAIPASVQFTHLPNAAIAAIKP